MSTSDLDQFRAEKDDFLAHDHRAPLTPEQRHNFEGLAYFPENSQLVIRTQIDRNVEPGEVRMATTGGEEQVFRRFGVVRFEVDGDAAQVTLYSPEGSPDLFVPFRDETTGRETYGAGRYLDANAQGNVVVLDFSYAYNRTGTARFRQERTGSRFRSERVRKPSPATTRADLAVGTQVQESKDFDTVRISTPSCGSQTTPRPGAASCLSAEPRRHPLPGS
jgi:hypothetical protein